MSVGTRVRVFNRTMSVNYVSDELVRVFLTLANQMGLGVDYVQDNRRVLTDGLRTWLSEGSLKATYLEVYDQSGNLITRFDLQIQYGSIVEDEEAFYSDIESAKLAARKVGVIPTRCRYRIVVSKEPWASSVAGWSDTTLLSTHGLRARSVGDLVGSPHIKSSMSLWIR